MSIWRGVWATLSRRYRRLPNGVHYWWRRTPIETATNYTLAVEYSCYVACGSGCVSTGSRSKSKSCSPSGFPDRAPKLHVRMTGFVRRDTWRLVNMNYDNFMNYYYYWQFFNCEVGTLYNMCWVICLRVCTFVGVRNMYAYRVREWTMQRLFRIHSPIFLFSTIGIYNTYICFYLGMFTSIWWKIGKWT